MIYKVAIMKLFVKIGLAIAGMLVLTAGFSSCNKDDDADTLKLSQQEEQSLLFMREEEKLARDVYLYMFRKYDQMVFDHISGSEQTHMDAIAVLLEKYNITYNTPTEEGIFNDPDLQALYVELIAKGDSSLADALIVGATIEDLDIRDLELAIAEFENADILDTYSRLACGSRNHMRAFIRNLDIQNISYKPQFITREQFDSIIDGDHESCGF